MSGIEFKRGDLVAYVVGMPGPDMDRGVYLRREGDGHVVWAGVWQQPPFQEMRRLGDLFPAKLEFMEMTTLAERDKVLADENYPPASPPSP